MDVAALCLAHNWRRVAFIGTTKHAGKTTALNGFIRQATHKGLSVGLCSVGLDGERLDTIMGVEKPAIYAHTGTFVVSAERALEQSEARLEWLEELPVSSPLGRVMISKVISPGNVMLAGVRERAHVQLSVERLLQYGVDFCLVDGAFDRIAAAAPHLVDTAVVAVSAVAGKTPVDVAMHAQAFLTRFQLPAATNEQKQRFSSVRNRQVIGLWVAAECGVSPATDILHELPPHQGVFGLSTHAVWSEHVRGVCLPGAFTDGIAQELCHHPHPLDILIAHPAQVVASGDMLRQLFRRGHRLSVWDALPIAAMAVNPHHIRGYDLPRTELMNAVRDIAQGVPVYDAHVVEGVD